MKKTKSFGKLQNLSYFNLKTYAVVMTVLAVVGLLALGSSFAARGGGGKPSKYSGTLSMVLVNDANADGIPNWNDSLTFDVQTSAPNPTVRVDCYKSGSLVYTASAGFYADYPWSKTFVLKSQNWTGGAATCRATLYTVDQRARSSDITYLEFAAGE